MGGEEGERERRGRERGGRERGGREREEREREEGERKGRILLLVELQFHFGAHTNKYFPEFF